MVILPFTIYFSPTKYRFVMSVIGFVVAAQPQCKDPLSAGVGDCLGDASTSLTARVDTIEHWRCVYGQVVNDLRELLGPPPGRGWLWPSDWSASSDDSYYDYYGYHRNQRRQCDAVITQLQQRTQLVVNEYRHDVPSLLSIQQGIRLWRHLMLPFLIALKCCSCGSLYQTRVTVFDHWVDPDAFECECNRCKVKAAAHHEQMLAV
jgi:hypothetical protein